ASPGGDTPEVDQSHTFPDLPRRDWLSGDASRGHRSCLAARPRQSGTAAKEGFDMTTRRHLLTAVAAAILAVAVASPALAQGKGNGNGNGNRKNRNAPGQVDRERPTLQRR